MMHTDNPHEELAELNKRLTNIRTLIAGTHFPLLSRTERKCVLHQEQVMSEYAEILTERISLTATDFALGKACDLSGEDTCESCQ